MRTFKTAEELERERLAAMGSNSLTLPTDKILVIYARQSTKGQVFKRKESALQQTAEQLAWALEMGWSQDLQRLLIENQAKDGKIRNASGRLRIDEREGLSTVMLYINSGEAGAVKVRDVARLFRDEDLVGPVVFAKACKDHHVLVITDDYTYNFNDPKRGKEDYKKFIEEAQAAADFLNKHIKMMVNYRERRALRGEFSGHVVPIGFMLDNDRMFYLPNSDHAKPLKALFKRFRALGGNVATLRREIVGKPTFPDLPPEILERTGQITLTKVEGGWTIKSHPGLKQILTNPAYIGHIAYGGRIVKYNAHPAIVDEDDFWFAYYRLAKTDFDGNPIERPEGVTKRYNQATSMPYPALLGGLRNDGTPVITTNIGTSANVYVTFSGKAVTYCAIDRSSVTPWHHSSRINVDKLDRYFSERLVYRVGEALKQSASALASDEQTAQLEATYAAINQQLDQTLHEAEHSEDEPPPDPRIAIEASIAETKKRIAEKERVGHEASSEMSGEDLRQHYGALKRLRTNLAAMQQKLDRFGVDEQEQAEAKQKLPEVHQRWAAMRLESQRRFIRAATSRVTLDELQVGWLKLTIEWALLLGGDIIDEAYIWTSAGKRWTTEEEQILREHYATADRDWILEQLPDRAWEPIVAKAALLGLERSHSVGYWTTRMSVVPSLKLSVNDCTFMRDNDIPADSIIHTRVYWREYVSLPMEANGEATLG